MIATRAGGRNQRATDDESADGQGSLHEEATAIASSHHIATDDANGETSSEPTQIFFNSGELERELTGGDLLPDSSPAIDNPSQPPSAPEPSSPPQPIVMPPLNAVLPQGYGAKPITSAQASIAFAPRSCARTRTRVLSGAVATAASLVATLCTASDHAAWHCAGAHHSRAGAGIRASAQSGWRRPVLRHSNAWRTANTCDAIYPPATRQRTGGPIQVRKSGPSTRQVHKRAPSRFPRRAPSLLLPAFFVVGMLIGALASARSDFGTMQVQVNAGSMTRIFVDGVERGHPPLKIERLPVGAHLVIATDVNGASARQIIQIAEQETTTVVLAFPPAQGPSGREGSSDARPPARLQLEAPSNEGRSTAATSERTSARPAGSRDSQAASSSRTRATTGALNITSTPWSRIFIDGRDSQHNTPWNAQSLSPGSHTLGFRTPDGVMHTMPITVVAGETRAVSQEF
jgi:hypothetical protein